MQRRWVVSPAYQAAIAELRRAREQAGVTQRELARRLGKPVSFVNKIEIKERRLDVVELIAIARALAIAPDDLIGRMSDAVGADLEI